MSEIIKHVDELLELIPVKDLLDAANEDFRLRSEDAFKKISCNRDDDEWMELCSSVLSYIKVLEFRLNYMDEVTNEY